MARPSQKPPLDISAIRDSPVGDPHKPDLETQKEFEDLHKREKEANILSILQDIDERKRYARRIYLLISIWLIGIFLLLLLDALLSPWGLFTLDKDIVIAVVGGTTINVIGIFIVVARYLFPHRPG